MFPQLWPKILLISGRHNFEISKRNDETEQGYEQNINVGYIYHTRQKEAPKIHMRTFRFRLETGFCGKFFIYFVHAFFMYFVFASCNWWLFIISLLKYVTEYIFSCYQFRNSHAIWYGIKTLNRTRVGCNQLWWFMSKF